VATTSTENEFVSVSSNNLLEELKEFELWAKKKILLVKVVLFGLLAL
jgi:hypothetical protein